MVLVCLSVAPAVQADEEWTPALATRSVDTGIKLEWTTPDGPRGQNIAHTEVWRFTPLAPVVTPGDVPTAPGSWELHAIREGVAPYYVDETGTTGTFYFVRLVFLDGSMSSPSNPSSVDYPHCSWLYIMVPPKTALYCLFPPPFVEDWPPI